MQLGSKRTTSERVIRLRYCECLMLRNDKNTIQLTAILIISGYGMSIYYLLLISIHIYIYIYIYIIISRSSSVGIATGYGLDDWGSEILS
jgi:hypothetical protein